MLQAIHHATNVRDHVNAGRSVIQILGDLINCHRIVCRQKLGHVRAILGLFGRREWATDQIIGRRRRRRGSLASRENNCTVVEVAVLPFRGITEPMQNFRCDRHDHRRQGSIW
jgi:hypothetical protein